MNERYRNDAQQRILKIVIVMFSDVVNGLTPSVIAREVKCSAAVMTRDLANLREAGIADKDESTGCWRLTPRLPQQAIKVWTAIDAAERRLQEAKQRFTRIPDGQTLSDMQNRFAK